MSKLNLNPDSGPEVFTVAKLIELEKWAKEQVINPMNINNHPYYLLTEDGWIDPILIESLYCKEGRDVVRLKDGKEYVLLEINERQDNV